jgi:imidazolonepropionase-like amidohydrolase
MTAPSRVASLAASCLWLSATLPACVTTTQATPTKVLESLEASAHSVVEKPPRPAAGSLLLTGATVLTAAGAVHSPGWLLVVDGRIAALGAGSPPEGSLTGEARRLDMTGMTLTPGLIDAHSHLGVYPSPPLNATQEGNEMTAPVTAGVWAEHAFWPEDPGLERAMRGGITTLHVLPGSGNLIGGRGVTMHLRPTRSSRAMRFPGAPDTVKMACGENPKRVYGTKGTAPSTRMGNVRGYREAFIAAKRWLKENGSKIETSEVTRDLGMETLAGLLEGRLLAQVHCYTAQDMASFLHVADEFGFKVRAFHHALEAYKVRDILAERDIGVATWADWWGFKLEAWDGIEEAVALLAEDGVRVAMHSDSGEGIQRLNQEAAKALHSGLARGLKVDREEALRWITLHPAWMLGIDKEVGTLEVGKRADIVAWNRDPFSVYAKAMAVWVDGVQVLDLAKEQKDGRTPWSDFEVGREVAP